MALCKRVLQTGADSAFLFASFRRNLYTPSSTGSNGYGLQQADFGIGQTEWESRFSRGHVGSGQGFRGPKGVPTKQAEAITAAITEVLNDSLENVAHAFVSKAEMQKAGMLQESNLSKFKSEVKSSQEHHFSMLQRETEKLRGDIEKMRSELRYEIDKVTAGQRLDLNLERGRIRDELANQNAETTNLTNKLDREIHTLRAQLEAAKYDVIKYCIGTLVSISAVGLAVLRILL
ncbi:protein FMP32 mitochondrial [Prunus yedoensis var. nudiflora]|uniref:Protein FMP32 mitochondrial n=1 Tax=Prunus yedoensis var. nudiflora TaxID=2094558 RepID=A0A314Y378_PRUYE|nr:protein FMP32 mitochondrial [Prunus yedoensis var. nudiflora]